MPFRPFRFVLTGHCFLLFSLCCISLNAQEKAKPKLLAETGFLAFADNENLGLLFNLEPKIRVFPNGYFGLRIGVVANSQVFEDIDPSRYAIDDRSDNGSFSVVPTLDYYFAGNKFRPFFGGGIGPYLIGNDIDIFAITSSGLNPERIETTVKRRFGTLLRAGIESYRWRFSAEYNLIPNVNIELTDGQAIGTVRNSYAGLAVGLVIGGGGAATPSR